MFQFNKMRRVRDSSFNFIKYFAYTYYTLCIFVRSIYMFSFFSNSFSFSQISSSTSSKLHYMPRILMRKYALISTDKFLDIGIVESVSHVRLVISRQLHVHTSCYVEDIHQEACSYWTINVIYSPIIITDSISECGTC